MQTLPLTRDLVLVGGGHAHALVLLRWAMNPLPGARLTVIDPNPSAPYTGMLPGHVAGHYTQTQLEMDLVALARHAGARLILGRVEGVDADAQTLFVAGRPPVAYDIASLDIGITSDLPALPGFMDHAVAAKPLGAYARQWKRFLARVETGKAVPTIAIIGAGVAGVELALAMDHRLRHRPDRRITLIEHDEPLPNLGNAARKRLLAALETAGIAVRTGVSAQAVDAAGVRLHGGDRVDAALTLGSAGSRPQDWLAETGLDLIDGFVAVDTMLRSVSHPTLFAAGDCAHMTRSPRPKAGVFAVRQAPILAHNLRAALSGGVLRPYRPQRDYLKLISLGGKSALADKWGLPLRGRWLWRLKDRIDAKFMRMFHAFPAMPQPALPVTHALDLPQVLGDKPLCGGCGSKVGPDALRAALAGMRPQGDVGDDAALLDMGSVRQVIATDHLRAFTEDPWLMARIAAVHALGDIWAMGAEAQAALVSLVLPRQSDPLQARILAEIMDGIATVTGPAGARIVGGHTTQGAELTIGLTVTGLAGERVLTKGGARAGDALVLTKPIGSGTLLAAEMVKRAKGRDIAALWPYLTQPQDAAARLLAPVAHAMTDVTGFGLAGHLDEMLRAGGVAAQIDLNAVPILPGAEALAAAGMASTLAPANRAALAGRIDAPSTARAALLFDPQTAGGLLAALPDAQVAPMLEALAQAGYTAARIGTVTACDNEPALRVVS